MISGPDTKSATDVLNRLKADAAAARSEGRYEAAIRACMDCVKDLLSFVLERRRFTAAPIDEPEPYIRWLCEYLPPLLRRLDLETVLTLVSVAEETKGWAAPVRAGLADVDLAERIYGFIAEHPGCLQTDVISAFGPRARGLLYWAAQFRTITRSRSGRTYRLYPASEVHRTPYGYMLAM